MQTYCLEIKQHTTDGAKTENVAAQLQTELVLPEGFSLLKISPADACPGGLQPAERHLDRRLAETYTFALLQWPALFLLLELPGSGWQLFLKYALGIWISLIALAAYGGKRSGRMIFANAMLVELPVLWLVWWSFPGYGCWLWIIVAGALFYTAQRSLLTRQGYANAKELND